MGRAKELSMEIESDSFYDLPDKFASVHLLRNSLVNDAAMQVAFDGVCSYCGDFTKVVRLRTLVEIVDDIILRYFGEPDNEGVGWDSHFEKDIASFLNSLGHGIEAVNHEAANRSLIPPKEVDIIVKRDGIIKLLIEADGLFWHSVATGKDKFYHLDKTEQCSKLGYQLVHVFEDEWVGKQEIVKSRLKSMLGVHDNVVYARKCSIEELSRDECADFFNRCHLQGSCQASIRLGLVHNGTLVAAMSFGLRRKVVNGKRADGEYELLRFAVKLGCHVPGAASKLLSYFEKNFKPKKLLSYADRRWSQGKLYSALGFKLDHISRPNYWYLDSNCKERMYRYGFRKSMLPSVLDKFDPSKTEIENMFANGYTCIWDCGNYVFIKKYNV